MSILQPLLKDLLQPLPVPITGDGAIPSGPFSPLTLPGCGFWVDGSDESTITDISNSASIWAGKSSAGVKAEQPDAGKQPKTGLDTINGFNVLDFNGTSQALTLDSDIFGDLSTQSFTVFIVGKGDLNAATGTDYILAARGNRIYLVQKSTGELEFSYGSTSRIITSTFNASNLFVAMISNNADTNIATFRINGSEIGTNTSIYTGTATNLDICSQTTAVQASNFNGKLGEIAMYDRILTPTEISEMETYLNRWIA